MSGLLEIATFHLVEGATVEAFAATDGIDSFLRAQPGFVGRWLAADADGLFTDVVLWQDEASAHAAMERFGDNPAALACMMQIDQASLAMQHLAVQRVVEAV
jgi:hypothetical protein